MKDKETITTSSMYFFLQDLLKGDGWHSPLAPVGTGLDLAKLLGLQVAEKKIGQNGVSYDENIHPRYWIKHELVFRDEDSPILSARINVTRRHWFVSAEVGGHYHHTWKLEFPWRMEFPAAFKGLNEYRKILGGGRYHLKDNGDCTVTMEVVQ